MSTHTIRELIILEALKIVAHCRFPILVRLCNLSRVCALKLKQNIWLKGFEAKRQHS